VRRAAESARRAELNLRSFVEEGLSTPGDDEGGEARRQRLARESQRGRRVRASAARASASLRSAEDALRRAAGEVARLRREGQRALDDAEAEGRQAELGWRRSDRNVYPDRYRSDVDVDDDEGGDGCACGPAAGEGRCCGDGGSGPACLCRSLERECSPALGCQCGVHCANQVFQRRQYARVGIVDDAGGKGAGLVAREPIRRGRFVLEYAGEVVRWGTLARRVASKERTGTYFMDFGCSKWVIDAEVVGSLARFVNHSCAPNCEARKYHVDGKTCVGLYAAADIGEGEELTFDYQFELAPGGEPEPCRCGAVNCSGFISQQTIHK